MKELVLTRSGRTVIVKRRWPVQRTYNPGLYSRLRCVVLLLAHQGGGSRTRRTHSRGRFAVSSTTGMTRLELNALTYEVARRRELAEVERALRSALVMHEMMVGGDQ